MNIPIQNIYYLLCYAWDKLEEKEIVDVEPLDSTSLADLFARVLINGTNHLLKRGFDWGYVPQHEWTGRLRGRICFQEAIRTNATRTSRLPCEFDELSYNVLHNQILKATMRRLIRAQDLATESTEGLAQLYRRFSEIEDIELTGRVFGRVQLYRNNHFYDFLLKVCELIHRNLLVSEKSGSSKFMDFVRDKRQMAILFENFVRTFYRVHTDYKVKREDIYWRWIAADQVAAGLLPKMQTDISLTSSTRKIIIDCKFTPEATQHHYEAETLRSSHLFQINAYLTNLPDEKLTDTCEMMLLFQLSIRLCRLISWTRSTKSKFAQSILIRIGRVFTKICWHWWLEGLRFLTLINARRSGLDTLPSHAQSCPGLWPRFAKWIEQSPSSNPRHRK